jgi:hypothetical protein
MVTRVLAGGGFGDNVPDGLIGPLGLLIILLMGIATVLLIRNMNSRLRRLPERFPKQEKPAGETAEGASGSGAASSGPRSDSDEGKRRV